jgi:hypothetical protein
MSVDDVVILHIESISSLLRASTRHAREATDRGSDRADQALQARDGSFARR